MIAALFVQKNGVYFGLPNVDPWDEERDARNYPGPHRVIAHPPCSTWSHMAPVNKARYGHEIGSDDGCFESALASVKKYGGVLEHPASSLAWPKFGLPKPRGSGWIRDMFDHGWVCQFSQCAYGHRARKMTWLYFVGESPPPLNWRRPKPTAWISTDRPRADLAALGIDQLSSKEASRTPIELRDSLIAMVSECLA
jgi:hypothetical protein